MIMDSIDERVRHKIFGRTNNEKFSLRDDQNEKNVRRDKEMDEIY